MKSNKVKIANDLRKELGAAPKISINELTARLEKCGSSKAEIAKAVFGVENYGTENQK